MSGVITKFAITSIVMWMAPVAIMYGFYHELFPGSASVPVLVYSIYYVQMQTCST
jgi:hypothetical protein